MIRQVSHSEELEQRLSSIYQGRAIVLILN